MNRPPLSMYGQQSRAEVRRGEPSSRRLRSSPPWLPGLDRFYHRWATRLYPQEPCSRLGDGMNVVLCLRLAPDSLQS